MYSSFDRLESFVESSLAEGDHETALTSVRDFVLSAMVSQFAPGAITGSRRLDQLCKQVGDDFIGRDVSLTRLLQDFVVIPNRVLVLCTGLYKYGGTSLVIQDLLDAHASSECVVVASNSLSDMTADDIKTRGLESNVRIEVSPAETLTAKFDWLVRTISRERPAAVFVLNHHQDSVIISAVQAFVSKTKVIFYHHADYNLCLGVHMDGVVHVDPHNVGFYNCRENEGLADNRYIPMTVADLGVTRIGRQFMKDGALLTCASGTYHKFGNFYLYPYFELIVERLVKCRGSHIHIGNLPESVQIELRNRLVERGVDADRFILIEWTPSLWATLVEMEVDLFMGSYPIGGARTTIEVMGAGIPLFMCENYLSRFHGSRDIVYDSSLVWKYPDDFVRILSGITPAILRRESARSRRHFERYYSASKIDLTSVLRRVIAGRGTRRPPPMHDYEPDRLDRLLHLSHLDHVAGSRAAVAAVEKLARNREQNPPLPVSRRGTIGSRVSSLVARFSSRPDALDPQFYRLLYEDDLGAMSDDEIRAHYNGPGRMEGRLPNAGAFQMDLQRRHGALPSNFDEAIYLALNPDVAAQATVRGAGARHYLISGKSEGRRY